jgi:DNA-binding transcriptional regulator YiaG
MEWTPEQLRNLRKETGHTQESLAPLIGVSASTLRTWEQGVSKPGRMARRLLSDWFGKLPVKQDGVAA